MDINTDPKKIDELLSRGVAEVLVKDTLREKLLSGRRLRIKLGIDPTSPNLHIGRSITLLKLRDFQELGHQIIFLIGDFTGVIGDTSDKESERPMLEAETVAENMRTYADQAGKILDMSTVEVRYNSEWLGKLTYKEICEHADLFSVADFIARDNIKRRLEKGSRVSLRELLYPLMQGYDSVALEADVELGGMDQKFNVLAGRPLQEHFGQEPQDVVLNPLILGLDGRKMSSSWGNTIILTAEPHDMYGKMMRMQDSEIITYFELCTRVPMETVREYAEALQSGTNPRDIKMKLAHALVTMYHGREAADGAETQFVATFQKGDVPEDVLEVQKEDGETYADALVRLGVVASKKEIARLIDAGGIRDAKTGEKFEALPEDPDSSTVLKIGKRRFVRLV